MKGTYEFGFYKHHTRGKLKIVKVKGGLGNQMFQYAFAKELAMKTEEEVKIDYSVFGDLLDDPIRQPRLLKFGIALDAAKEEDINQICMFKHTGNSLTNKYRLKIALEGVLNRKYYFEKDRGFRSVEKLKKYQYFDGYWQSWQHVDKVMDDLKKEFVPNYLVSQKSQNVIDCVKSQNSVFVGIRKGDYTSAVSHFGSFGNDYYENAMKYIDERIDNPQYYIFSNDIDWVKKNMDFGSRTIIYREKEDIVDDFEDLLIMMNCKHSIMINSTYHWWGARMNDNPDKIVVAPQKWFFDDKPIDIIPPNWVRI